MSVVGSAAPVLPCDERAPCAVHCNRGMLPGHSPRCTAATPISVSTGDAPHRIDALGIDVVAEAENMRPSYQVMMAPVPPSETIMGASWSSWTKQTAAPFTIHCVAPCAVHSLGVDVEVRAGAEVLPRDRGAAGPVRDHRALVTGRCRAERRHWRATIACRPRRSRAGRRCRCCRQAQATTAPPEPSVTIAGRRLFEMLPRDRVGPLAHARRVQSLSAASVGAVEPGDDRASRTIRESSTGSVSLLHVGRRHGNPHGTPLDRPRRVDLLGIDVGSPAAPLS